MAVSRWGRSRGGSIAADASFVPQAAIRVLANPSALGYPAQDPGCAMSSMGWLVVGGDRCQRGREILKTAEIASGDSDWIAAL